MEFRPPHEVHASVSEDTRFVIFQIDAGNATFSLSNIRQSVSGKLRSVPLFVYFPAQLL